MSESSKPEEEVVFVADNIDEFVQRTRYQQILEARKDARDALQSASLREAEFRERMNPTEAKLAKRDTIQEKIGAFILECESLYQKTEAGRQLWSAAELGTVPIRKLAVDKPQGDNVESVEYVELTKESRLKIDPESHTVTLTGISDYLAIPEATARYTYEVGVAYSRHGTETEKALTRLSTPVSVSKEAFRATDALLDHFDLGLELGESTPSVEGANEYADLLHKLDDE